MSSSPNSKSPETPGACVPGVSTAHPALCLVALLHGTRGVLVPMAAADYAAPGRGDYTSSIGKHVRHQLDHVFALINGIAVGRVDYEARRRGTAIESELGVALQAIADASAVLAAAADVTSAGAGGLALGAAVEVVTQVDCDTAPLVCQSTWGRELAFVICHTIHHNAIIGMIAADLGYAVPRDFMFAPSTLSYLNSGSCAHSA